MTEATTDDTARLAATIEAEALQRAGTITYTQARQRIRDRQASPVARVVSWTSGSYSRNYRLEWLRDVPEDTELYAALQAAPAAAAPVQPLTDALIDALWKAPMSFDWEHQEFARAIERACAEAWGVTLAATPAKEPGHE